MTRGTKSFQKQKNGDDHKVLPIMQYLTSLGYQCFREPTISNASFSTRNHIRRPDIKVVWGKCELYIEIDGRIHGNLELPTHNTVMRNIDFIKTNMRYIILSEEDCKFYGLDIKGLAGYRVSEELRNFEDRMEAGALIP